MKNSLSCALVLSMLTEGEDSFLVVSKVTVNFVLMRDDNGKQKPVFYTSKNFMDVETRYNTMEKMVLVLVNAKKKITLKPTRSL